MKKLLICLSLLSMSATQYASQMQRPPAHIQAKLDSYQRELEALKKAARSDAAMKQYVDKLDQTTRVIEQKSQMAKAAGQGQMTDDIKRAIDAQQEAIQNLIDNAKQSNNPALKNSADRLEKIQNDLIDAMQEAEPKARASKAKNQRKPARKVVK